MVDSFKSTLDEVREADVILHVVDISHPNFEDQIRVVNETMTEIDKREKPTFLVFNKIDAFSYVKKDEDDLLPKTRENFSLEELKQMWVAKGDTPCIFISAVEKQNIEEFREKVYEVIREIHSARFPFNDFLYQDYSNLMD